jgi:UDP-N-acetylmuramyl pentapeptide phosphotransferase/UDP-N-acetylglucosamine-1-phosphate transferase
MKKMLIFGLFFLILGLVITYFLITVLIRINQTFAKVQEGTESLLAAKKNMVYSSSIIGVLIILGFYLIKKLFSNLFNRDE